MTYSTFVLVKGEMEPCLKGALESDSRGAQVEDDQPVGPHGRGRGARPPGGTCRMVQVAALAVCRPVAIAAGAGGKGQTGRLGDIGEAHPAAMRPTGPVLM